MKRKQFKAELLSGHKDNAIEVPFDPAGVWGIPPKPLWRGRRGHEVHGKLNGLSFESCIVPRQKKFFMIVDEEIMKAAKLSVGDIVTTTAEPLG
jgi:hypothetical protein